MRAPRICKVQAKSVVEESVQAHDQEKPTRPEMDRRAFVKESVLVSAGAAAAWSGLAQAAEPVPGGPPTGTNLPAAKECLPKGKIRDLEISRLLLGGNLLTHFTHSRDLRYVYNLAAHYNTDEKILETMAVAEANGIDTLTIHNPPHAISLLKRYRQERGGKIKWIICPTAPAEPGMAKYTESVQQLIDDGADAIYLWGVRADGLCSAQKIDLIGQAVEIAKAQGVPSGVGAHELSVIVECEKNKITADFYIKTFHHHNYPSAKLEHDSMWCKNPEETAEFMKTVQKPWIAFKTMAAGAIQPRNAFQYSFENGADFVLAGMFDYEIAEDVKTARDILGNLSTRNRPWRA